MMGKMYDIMLQLTEDINDKLDDAGDFMSRAEKAEITRIVKDSYNMDEEEDDMLGAEGEDAVLADEYGEGAVLEKPRKEI
ncbi:unnamed protein product [Closterium sp. NIES-64]|nr:unnamed protein product [Closterium sp. NIES-64]